MQKLASHEVVELSEAQLRLVAGGTGGDTNGGHCCSSSNDQNSRGFINVLNGNNVAVGIGILGVGAASASSS